MRPQDAAGGAFVSGKNCAINLLRTVTLYGNALLLFVMTCLVAILETGSPTAPETPYSNLMRVNALGEILYEIHVCVSVVS